jgi:hypothetical protein
MVMVMMMMMMMMMMMPWLTRSTRRGLSRA